MYVIDVLRCSFEVKSPGRLLELKQLVEESLPNARVKNGYSIHASAPAGYRDMKLNGNLKLLSAGGSPPP